MTDVVRILAIRFSDCCKMRIFVIVISKHDISFLGLRINVLLEALA